MTSWRLSNGSWKMLCFAAPRVVHPAAGSSPPAACFLLGRRQIRSTFRCEHSKHLQQNLKAEAVLSTPTKTCWVSQRICFKGVFSYFLFNAKATHLDRHGIAKGHCISCRSRSQGVTWPQGRASLSSRHRGGGVKVSQNRNGWKPVSVDEPPRTEVHPPGKLGILPLWTLQQASLVMKILETESYKDERPSNSTTRTIPV